MNKKFVTVLCDGMADYPDERGLTPMCEARKPVADALCEKALCGLVKTVPDGMKPGSDVCNLAALGYDPELCYTGRSPLEALSIGIPLGDGDVTYRVNLVTLSDGNAPVMLDYSAGEISTAEAVRIIDSLRDMFAGFGVELYAGVSYRHAAVIRGGAGHTGTALTTPHDILDKPIADFLPDGVRGKMFCDIIARSREILKTHPVNIARLDAGKRPVSCVWFWGEGTKPKLEPFRKMTGKTAAVISAVDLVKGIGIGGGMTVINISTATGTADTDYEAKTAAALAALETHDFCFIHLEGPDECGHQGDRRGKITAIERIDARILKPVYDSLKASGAPFAITVMPDHATPLCVRTHTGEPIPFFIYDSEKQRESGISSFTESNAAATKVYFPKGGDVIRAMFGAD